MYKILRGEEEKEDVDLTSDHDYLCSKRAAESRASGQQSMVELEQTKKKQKL